MVERFFDVDGTLYNGESSLDFIRFAVEHNHIEKDILETIQALSSEYRSGNLSYFSLVRNTIETVTKSFHTMSTSHIDEIASKWTLSSYFNPYDFSKPLMTFLTSHGITPVLVSATPQPLIQAIAHTIGAHATLATEPEVINGVYSGTITRLLNGEEKPKAILDLITSSDQILIGVGDSTGDIPMLRLAQHAFVINIHQDEFRIESQKQKWTCVNPETILSEIQKVVLSTQ